MTLWCGKCSRTILCLDILQVQSTICISHLHCNLMLSISNCAFSSFRSSLYWISIKFEGTKRSQKSSLEPLELAITLLQRMPSRPIRNGLAHLGSASLCSVHQPACAMRRTVCRLRAVTAAVTYVTQPISWKPRKSSGVLGYASGPPSEVSSSLMPYVTKIRRRAAMSPAAPWDASSTMGQLLYLSTTNR